MDKKRKKILATIAALSMIGYFSYDYHYTPNYEIIMEDSKAFARYSKGLVYIGHKKFLSNLKNVKEEDILVLDERNNNDPNMCVFSSYLIDDKNVRNEILEILLEYEQEYPSNWDRTIDSMRIEWFMHNLLYFFNYETKRTTDVDLNNNNEEIYDLPIIKKIIKI